MAFRYHEMATPCPSNPGMESVRLAESPSPYENDTAAIDFTTDLSLPAFTKENPRRANRMTSFKIHDDGQDKLQNGTIAQASKPSLRKPAGSTSSMFAQPPQRLPRPRVGVSSDTLPRSGLKKPGRQTSSGNMEHSTGSTNLPVKDNGKARVKSDNLKKDKRRNTIYVPPDDTTMPDVFRGLLSPLKEQDVPGCATSKIENNGSQRRQTRTLPPMTRRRSQLQQSMNPAQESRSPHDIAGRKTGKENIPPGASSPSQMDVKKDPSHKSSPLVSPPVQEHKERVSIQAQSDSRHSSTATPRPAEKRTEAQKGRTSNNTLPMETQQKVTKSDSKTTRLSHGYSKPRSCDKRSCGGSSKKPSPVNPSKPPVKKRQLPNTSIPPVNNISIDHKYPVLSENILNPSMYEEKWLEHQEIAITQLANSVFDSTHEKPDIQDGDTFRQELLKHYQSPYFALLYKRVLASVLHGALRVPQDVIRRGNRLKNDVGVRRKFLNLWLDTYHLTALRAVAETVIGRRLSPQQHESNESNNDAAKDDKALRRAVQTFLETFLIRNEDAGAPSGTESTESSPAKAGPYHKTVLRSIMMITLLDKARMETASVLPDCLFLRQSKHKSSAAAMQALGSLLLPTTDILRALNHLDCQLSYQQYPLQEYEYRIHNLAVDLRDGIIVTRLVELLFFAPRQGDDAPSSITLPTEEVLRLLPEEAEWPLSQHLKAPCKSRAAKLFNVQVALTALSSVAGVASVIEDTRPADIVDGHREKTIALLWALVGKWGLPALIDWNDVRREIVRLERKYEVQTGHAPVKLDVDEDSIDNSDQQLRCLLRKWASRLASLKGLSVANLTTSFADGRIFESIIDEYEGYIKASSTASEKPVVNETSCLKARLRSLGCSTQFASLVTPISSRSSLTTHIYDQDFTLGALAFLCSRLLPASRHARAAITIQSAWRRVGG